MNKTKCKWPNKTLYRSIILISIEIGQVVWILLLADRWTNMMELIGPFRIIFF